MKALLTLLLLPALMLIGCGKMETNQDTANNVLQGMVAGEYISEQDAADVDESLLEEQVEITEIQETNTVVMKVGGTELVVDFLENITGAQEEVTMLIEGVEVTRALAEDKDSLKALVASLVQSKLEGKEVLGIPAMDLVQIGLGLLNKDTRQAGFAGLFGTLIKGALNMFLASQPWGMIAAPIVNPIIDNVVDNIAGGGSNSASQSPNNGNQNNSGGLLRGLLGGGQSSNNNGSPLGGIFSLIMNLFK